MLNEAIEQVREDVLKGKELQGAVKSAAEDFELNPVLVARKFAEKFGSVEQVLSCAAHASKAKTLDDLAMEQAEKWSKQFVSKSARFGRRFKIEGVQYIYVANKGGSRPVIAIDVARAMPVELGGKFAEIAFQA